MLSILAELDNLKFFIRQHTLAEPTEMIAIGKKAESAIAGIERFTNAPTTLVQAQEAYLQGHRITAGCICKDLQGPVTATYMECVNGTK